MNCQRKSQLDLSIYSAIYFFQWIWREPKDTANGFTDNKKHRKDHCFVSWVIGSVTMRLGAPKYSQTEMWVAPYLWRGSYQSTSSSQGNSIKKCTRYQQHHLPITCNKFIILPKKKKKFTQKQRFPNQQTGWDSYFNWHVEASKDF